MSSVRNLLKSALALCMVSGLHAQVHSMEESQPSGLSDQEEALVVGLSQVEFVYVPENVRDLLVALHDVDEQLSSEVNEFCRDLKNGLHIAPYDSTLSAVTRMIRVLSTRRSTIAPADYSIMSRLLSEYAQCLINGDALIKFEEEPAVRGCCKKRKCKVFGSLLVQCRLTAGQLVVSGDASVGGNLTVAGTIFGPNGPLGATGATGADGTGDVLAYGYIYNTATQAVALEAPITFDSNGPLLGVTHLAGSANIVVTVAGIYAITFSVSGNEPNQFAIFVNGIPQSSAIYSTVDFNQQNTGQAILSLAANDIITIVNHTSSIGLIILPDTVGGSQENVNASVLIERLHSIV